MQELFPIVAGGLVGGLVFLTIRSQLWRVVAFVAGCIVFGFLASWLSGELEESWGFLSIDMLLVWLGGLAAVALLTILRHRTAISRALFKSGDTNRRN